MDIKEKSEVSNEVEKKSNPSDIEETNFELSDYKITKNGNLISTSKQCHSEDRLSQSFSSCYKNDESHDKSKAKEVFLAFTNWIQIQVPNNLSDNDLYYKAKSISEANYVFLKNILLENKKENLKNGGEYVQGILVADVPRLNEDKNIISNSQ